MKSIRWIPILAIPLFFSLLMIQTSCSKQPAAQDIATNTLVALENVSNYHLSTHVYWVYTVFGGSASGKSTVNWTGERQVDITNKALQKTLVIDNEYSTGDKAQWEVEEYISQGYQFEKVNSNSGSSNIWNVWFKYRSTDDGWAFENQIGLLINLLKSSTNNNPAGSETLSGTDCSILEIKPSAEAIAEWTHKQFQGYGAADLSTGPALVGTDNYRKHFKNGTFKVWIAKDNYLVMKAEIDPSFEATPADLGTHPGDFGYIGFDKVTSTFNGEMVLEKYNQPVLIEVPQEAMEALLRE